ncbi:MAG: acetyl-CoA carboxylase biotin carboxyl carrier protein [Chitinophagaceae bacterium]
MDFKQIQELIKIINKSNIGEIRIEDKDFKIILKQKQEQTQATAIQPSVSASQQPFITNAPVASPSLSASTQTATSTTLSKQENFITIKSPMIGTFYRRPSPDKPILAEVGDEITPGKVVCIIEAMKLFNEIESEVSGKIIKVLAEDASPVEYDQPLFLVEPS